MSILQLSTETEDIISTELPDPDEDPISFGIVKDHISRNPQNWCKSTKKFTYRM